MDYKKQTSNSNERKDLVAHSLTSETNSIAEDPDVETPKASKKDFKILFEDAKSYATSTQHNELACTLREMCNALKIIKLPDSFIKNSDICKFALKYANPFQTSDVDVFSYSLLLIFYMFKSNPNSLNEFIENESLHCLVEILTHVPSMDNQGRLTLISINIFGYLFTTEKGLQYLISKGVYNQMIEKFNIMINTDKISFITEICAIASSLDAVILYHDDSSPYDKYKMMACSAYAEALFLGVHPLMDHIINDVRYLVFKKKNIGLALLLNSKLIDVFNQMLGLNIDAIVTQVLSIFVMIFSIPEIDTHDLILVYNKIDMGKILLIVKFNEFKSKSFLHALLLILNMLAQEVLNEEEYFISDSLLETYNGVINEGSYVVKFVVGQIIILSLGKSIEIARKLFMNEIILKVLDLITIGTPADVVKTLKMIAITLGKLNRYGLEQYDVMNDFMDKLAELLPELANSQEENVSKISRIIIEDYFPEIDL